jgi:PKD repeat protein
LGFIYSIISSLLVKTLHILLIFFLLCGPAFSQLSQPGIPESYRLGSKKEEIIPSKGLNVIDTAYLLAEDKEKGIQNRFGVVEQMEVNIKKEGLATNIDGKGTIWQYELTSQAAYSLGIHFSTFHLPEGATVFIYNEARTHIAGAFTSINNCALNQLPVAGFRGQNAIIEYFEPLNSTFPGELTIGAVSQAYRNLLQPNPNRIGINCPEGAQWQDIKHAVCLMTFFDTQYSYECTGFLVNNMREDGTPYFQTANHCINNSNLAATLVTYFNYENSTCTSSDAMDTMTLAGATISATSDYSDFTLLLLNEYPPSRYFPYFAGWDASNAAPQTGTTIHHPSGTPKCISLDANPPTTYPFSITWQDNNVVTNTTLANTNWEILLTSGIIESGSSGSPLFNEKQLAIGQLHGGTGTDDFYGKFSISWNQSTIPGRQLMHWLDPDNTGTLNLQGTYMTVKPLARFSTIFTKVCKGAPIQFKDQSKFAPKQWKWNITPSGYYFANGTNSNSQNPEIVFFKDGNYSVSLTIANDYGSDSLLKTDYISAGNIQVTLTGLPADGVVCGCNLNDYSMIASGADSYSFKIERTDKISQGSIFNQLYLSLIPAEKKNGSFNSWITVTGTQGTCIVSDSLLLKVSMPPNDDIENAIMLSPGTNGIYSNFCASVQSNEPYPSTSSCLSSDSWCPVLVNPDSVLSHTIWFTFVGPPNGLITIDTRGFNDRIAIYEALNYGDILANTTSYKIIAANDDRSTSDLTAFLQNIVVNPNKTYWMQLDGYNKATGDCTISLLGNSIEVYPNPSSGIFNIIFSTMADGVADVQIYSPVGTMVYSEKFNVTLIANHFTFDLSTLSQGIYFIQAKINGTITQAKLMYVK